MTLLELRQKVAGRVLASRVAIFSVMLSGLVGMASAVGTSIDLNGSLYSVIGGLTLLFTPLLAVIIAAVPLIVTIPDEDPFLLGFVQSSDLSSESCQ